MLIKIISVLLVISPISIYFAKGTMGFLIILTLFLMLDIILEKKVSSKLIGFIVLIIIFLNFNKIKPYFIYGISFIDINSTIEYAIRIIAFMSLTYFFSNRYKVELVSKYIVKYSNILLLEIIVSQIYLIYLFISGKGYTQTWGLKNYVGPYMTPHTYAYSIIIMIIMIEILFLIKRSNKIMFLYIFPVLSSFLCGARTPVMMMFIIFIIIRKFKTNTIVINTRFKIKNILIVLGIMIIITLFSNEIIKMIINSNIVTKFIETASEQNFDNGRVEYWNICMKSYLQSDILRQLLGNGIYSTVLDIKNSLGYEIWAHSDWVDIINSYGLIIVIIYTSLYINYFIKLRKWSGKKYMITFLGMAFIFLSTYNGIINYTHFLFVFCYISILALECSKEELE